jgi:ABC-type Fe3+ transport system permease subunit/DNA-binding beta-propeller fold protein YncE
MNWLLLKNSFLVSALTTLLAGSFGFIAALWLAALGRSWRMRILVVAILSLALPPFLVTNCWLDLLGHTGVWRRWLPFNIISLGGTVWVLSLLLWPVTLFPVLGAWQRLEQAQVESDMAVTGWALIRALLLPLARTSLIQAAVLTFVLALNNFAVPATLQVKVFPAEVWVRFSTGLNAPGALRLSWPLVVAPLLLLLWMARREFSWPRLQGPVAPELLRQQIGPAWLWLCGSGTVVLCLLSLGVPLVELVSLKRTWTELPQALAANQTAVWNSFSLAVAAATLVIGLAIVGGTQSVLGRASRLVGSSKRRAFATAVFGSLLWLPLLVPGVLLGIGLSWLFNRPWFWLFYPSTTIVILAFVIRYFGLGWNTVAHAFCTVDRDLLDDARLNGATRWQMFRFVQWPQISLQFAAAWYVVFLLCLWDVESMILVWPPGGETLALTIFNLLHYGHNAQVNALCLTLLGLAVAPLVVWRIWLSARSGSGNASHVSRFTFHASRITFLTAPMLLLAGCVPKSPSNETSLPSQIFNQVQVIGHRGVGVGELNKPRSVAVDKQDNLYVVDMTGRVQKFSPNGVFLLSWQMPQTDLGKPKGMGRDHDGNIIVVEPHYQRVNHFSPEGKLLAQWGAKGTNAGQFMLPRAVAVNSRGQIYVSEYGTAERVQQFELPGFKFLNSFGRAGTTPGEFNRPEGLCIDGQDRIYVADSCNHRIQVFSSDGKFIRTYGKAGMKKGELSYPYDICVDAAGRQYVCEFGNSRIQVFDANGQSIEIIGGPGAEPGRFSNPWGVALDSAGNLYVADSQNHRVQKLIKRQSMANAEAPSSKLQAPEKLQMPSSKHVQAAATWILDLGVSLDLGSWILNLGPPTLH